MSMQPVQTWCATQTLGTCPGVFQNRKIYTNIFSRARVASNNRLHEAWIIKRMVFHALFAVADTALVFPSENIYDL